MAVAHNPHTADYQRALEIGMMLMNDCVERGLGRTGVEIMADYSRLMARTLGVNAAQFSIDVAATYRNFKDNGRLIYGR